MWEVYSSSVTTSGCKRPRVMCWFTREEQMPRTTTRRINATPSASPTNKILTVVPYASYNRRESFIHRGPNGGARNDDTEEEVGMHVRKRQPRHQSNRTLDRG